MFKETTKNFCARLLYSRIRFAQLLKQMGFTYWIDDEQNKGNMRLAIAEGIRNSRIFLAFFTRRYNEKVEKGRKAKEWVYFEFNYANDVLSPNLFLITFEEGLRLRKGWTDLVHSQFSNELYYDLPCMDRSAAWSNFLDHMRERITELKKGELSREDDIKEVTVLPEKEVFALQTIRVVVAFTLGFYVLSRLRY
jgi:hypothetical protein